jgi:hypothetical protein
MKAAGILRMAEEGGISKISARGFEELLHGQVWSWGVLRLPPQANLVSNQEKDLS